MSSKRVLFAAVAGTLAIGFAAPVGRAQEAVQGEPVKEAIVLEFTRDLQATIADGDDPAPANAEAEAAVQFSNSVVVAQAEAAALVAQAEEEQSRLWIGVQLATEVPPALAHHFPDLKGALVETVYPDSPATETGVEPFDLIVKLGDVDVTSSAELVEAMKSAESKPIELVVQRGGKTQKLSVTPREREAPKATNTANVAELENVYGLAVPHVRLLPGLHGVDSHELAGRIATQYFTPTAPAALPEGVDTLRVEVRREEGDVADVLVVVNGKEYRAKGDEIAKLPPEILAYVPQAGAPHAGPFTFKLQTQPAPTAANVRRLNLNVMPPVTPPGVPAPPPPVAIPAPHPNPVWVDVFTHPRGLVAGAPVYTPAVAPPAVPIPSQAVDDLRADVNSLKASLERIEAMLQQQGQR